MNRLNSITDTPLHGRAAAFPWLARAAATSEPQPEMRDAEELFVETFARGLAVIRSFANRQEPLTIADVARRAGVSRSAARRLLHTLVALGYVSTAEQRFTLLPKTLLLASAFLSSDVLAVAGQSIVSRIAGATGMFCGLDVPQGRTALLVCMAYKSKPSEIDLPEPNVGMVAPLYCSSGGQLFLSTYTEAELNTYLDDVKMHAYTHHTISDGQALHARLAQVRQQGWAAADREMSNQLRSISVPVTDRSGRTVAGLMVIAPPQLASLAELEAVLPVLRGGAQELGSML